MEYYLKSEKAIAEYYMKSGYNVISEKLLSGTSCDFYALNGSEKVAVEIKVLSYRHQITKTMMKIDRFLLRLNQNTENDSQTRIDLVFVLRDYDIDYPVNKIHSKIYSHFMKFSEEMGTKIIIKIGYLNDENEYVPLQQ
ncbi:hypothetical protein [Anabaena azotica]|uniref:hypothetical protein n=1 Tax=Anabaena azotica TaxID=197653 RepID=UPI0039A53877